MIGPKKRSRMRAVRVKVIGPKKRVRPRQEQCETILLLKSVSLKMSESEHSDTSTIPVSFRTPKCCNYLLTAKQQKESHYSRNEAMLPREASFHQRMKKSGHMIKCLLTE